MNWSVFPKKTAKNQYPKKVDECGDRTPDTENRSRVCNIL